MSEVKKIATRESYGNALVELGKEHEDLVVLDADLAAATKTGPLRKHPGTPHRLRYRREQYDGRGGRPCGGRKGSVCQFLCHVRGRTRV